MKRRGWILVGSLATLVLCAAPYGCSGKLVESPTMGDGNGTFIPPMGDGIARTEGTGYATDGAGQPYSEGKRDGTFMATDGAYVPVTEGMPGDGGNYPPIQGDGADYSGEGSVDYAEGQRDGSTTTPEGDPQVAQDGCDADGCYYQ